MGCDSEGGNPSRHVVAVLGNRQSNLQVEVELITGGDSEGGNPPRHVVAVLWNPESTEKLQVEVEVLQDGGDSEGENPSRHVVAVLGNPESNLQVEVEVLRDDAVMFQQFIMASQPVSEDISQVGEFETISETDVPDVCLQGLEVMPDLSSPDLLSSIKNDPLPKTFLRINGLKRKKDNSSPSISGLSEPKKSRKKIPPKPEPNQGINPLTAEFVAVVQWLSGEFIL
ncbi:hypothetical protein J6590_088578 [Homalodisca vitripennis]|nr:hypothetical protein J6590_088578 [Homalodisca vitripennis]